MPKIVAKFTAPFLKPLPAIMVACRSTIKMMDADLGAELWTWDLPNYDQCVCGAISPCAERFAIATCDGKVYILDTDSGKFIGAAGPFMEEPLEWLAFSPSGSSLAAGADDGRVLVVCMDSLCPGAVKIQGEDTKCGKGKGRAKVRGKGKPKGSLLWAVRFANCPIISVSYAMAGERLAVATYAGSLFLCDAQTGAQVWQLDSLEPIYDGIGALAYAAAGQRLAFGITTSSGKGALQIFQAESGVTCWAQHFEDGIACLAYAAECAHLAVGHSKLENHNGRPDTVRVLHADSGVPLWAMQLEADISCLAYDPHGDRLAVGTFGSSRRYRGTVHVLNASSGTELRKLESAYKMSFGSRLLTALDAVCALAYQPSSHASLDNHVAQTSAVIQKVEHGDDDDVKDILEEEAALIEDELWASRVEARIAQDTSASATLGLASCSSAGKLVLLTFSRGTSKLEKALLASPAAKSAARSGIDVKPRWANGAKVLTDVRVHTFLSMRQMALRPWHVLVSDADEEAVLQSLNHLPHSERRLRSREILEIRYSSDSSNSARAQGDDARRMPCVVTPVTRTFIHYQDECDTRGPRSV